MKSICLTCFLLISGFGISQPSVNRSGALLEWLISKDHITYLYTKSDADVFYDENALVKRTVTDGRGKALPGVCLKDYLSEKEINIYKTAPPMLMLTDWRVKFPQMDVKFVNEKISFSPSKPVYYFSEPVFLNPGSTRVIIGESFTCGIGCGRQELLLCDFKNNQWRLLARAAIVPN